MTYGPKLLILFMPINIVLPISWALLGPFEIRKKCWKGGAEIYNLVVRKRQIII
jgi:hypothetical protein